MVVEETHKLLLRAQDFGPAVLLVELGGHVRRAVLLQTSLHTVDARPADFEASVDRRRVEAGLQQFGLDVVSGVSGGGVATSLAHNLPLDLRRLLASPCDRVSQRTAVRVECFVRLPGILSVHSRPSKAAARI